MRVWRSTLDQLRGSAVINDPKAKVVVPADLLPSAQVVGKKQDRFFSELIGLPKKSG